MTSRRLGLPTGFRDLVFEDAARRRDIEARCARIFAARRYAEIVPSSVEYLDLYLRGNQSAQEKAYRFLDRDDNLLALRADFTPAIARIVTARAESLGMPARLWYSGNVFRRQRVGQKSYSELWQIGAELIGVNTVERDAEIIDLAMECLQGLGLDGIQIHINHAGIFQGIIDSLGLEPEKRKALKSEIDRKDTRGLAEHLTQLGVSSKVRSQLDTLTRSAGGEDVLRRLLEEITNDESRSALQNLLDLAGRLGHWRDAIVFDVTEVDEMEYYTGIMFAFLRPGARNELGSGGRYDGLLGEYGVSLPAVGFSLNVDALMPLVQVPSQSENRAGENSPSTRERTGR